MKSANSKHLFTKIRKILGTTAVVLGLLAMISGCASAPATVDGASGNGEIRQSSAQYSGKDDGQLIFWELTRDGQTLYILGSIHVANEQMYPLSQTIISAFSESDVLIEEIDVAQMDNNDVQNYVVQHSQLPEGKTLDQFLSEEDLSSLQNILNAYGIPYQSVSSYRPWIVDNTLGLLSAYELNLDSDAGIDLYFARLAGEYGLPIMALEEAVDQLEMLDSISLEAQLWSLKQTIRDFDELADSMHRLVSAYTKGSISQLEELVLGDIQDSAPGREYYQQVYLERNQAWSQIIDELYANQDEKTYFVVAGAGHMIGPQGLIQLLIDEGFTAQRY